MTHTGSAAAAQRIDRQSRVFVAGHRGMVGSAIARRLRGLGYGRVVTADRRELDLIDQNAVRRFFVGRPFDAVVLAAARVGGIQANDSYPADFLYDNLMIEANVIRSAHDSGVQRLLFLGSSCIYPRLAVQPMHEDALLTGPLESSNEPYAVAKIAGIKLCESFNRQFGRDYRSVMPANLYGPNDNFHLDNAHVIPALLHRFHRAARSGAATVTVWGSGTPRREFLHVDDLATACVFVLELDAEVYKAQTRPMCSHLNVGSGVDCTIRELAETIARVVGFGGRLVFDASKPDGTPRKLLDVSRLAALGWRAGIDLESGLRDTYQWFLRHHAQARL